MGRAEILSRYWDHTHFRLPGGVNRWLYDWLIINITFSISKETNETLTDTQVHVLTWCHTSAHAHMLNFKIMPILFKAHTDGSWILSISNNMEEDREMVLSKLLILWLIDLACSDDVCPQVYNNIKSCLLFSKSSQLHSSVIIRDILSTLH